MGMLGIGVGLSLAFDRHRGSARTGHYTRHGACHRRRRDGSPGVVGGWRQRAGRDQDAPTGRGPGLVGGENAVGGVVSVVSSPIAAQNPDGATCVFWYGWRDATGATRGRYRRSQRDGSLRSGDREGTARKLAGRPGVRAALAGNRVPAGYANGLILSFSFATDNGARTEGRLQAINALFGFGVAAMRG